LTHIKESRYSKIQNRVIDLNAAYKLASIVNEEYLKSKNSREGGSISFLAKCADKSSFESKDVSIFSADSMLNTKRVESLEMTYHSYHSKSSINIELAHGDTEYGNSITIRGEDSTWVNGIMRKLEDVLNSFKPQNTFIKNHKGLFNIVFALSIGTILMWIIRFIFSPQEPPTDLENWEKSLHEIFDRFPIVQAILRYSLGIVVGYLPAKDITNKLISLWPSIEIQIGPEHTFLEKNRRKWIINAVLLGLVPLLVSLIYDFLKGNLF